MSEHFEDSMGQQELPCDKCGKCCYLMDKVDACYTQLLVAEVLRLREKNESLLRYCSEEEKTIDEWCVEVKRLREVMIFVEQRQPHPALEWALKEGLTLTEIKERIE